MITAKDARKQTNEHLQEMHDFHIAELRVALEDEISKAIKNGCFNVRFRPADRISKEVVRLVLNSFSVVGYNTAYNDGLAKVDWSA